MKNRLIAAGVILFCTICLSLFAFQGENTYSTYEDCVLENIKGVESDKAAYFVAKSCRLKFPAPVVYITEAEAYGETTAVK